MRNKYIKLNFIKNNNSSNHDFYESNSTFISANLGFKF